MRYKNIDELDARIERIIDSTVKHYYSDWKKYDRLKYMCCKGSNNADDKRLVLLPRTCGTYLITAAGAFIKDSFEEHIYNYFQNYESCDYWLIDLNRLEVKKIKPTLSKQEIK